MTQSAPRPDRCEWESELLILPNSQVIKTFTPNLNKSQLVQPTQPDRYLNNTGDVIDETSRISAWQS